MEHLFIDGNRNLPVLLLLHGTGGDEHDLLTVADMLSPDSPKLALRGTVQENGMNRFFERYSEGQFNLEDLEKRSDELLEELSRLSKKYQLPIAQMIPVGYSNGANIAGHIMLERQGNFNTAILFHGMFLGRHTQSFPLAEQSIWLSAGVNDPIVPFSTAQDLQQAFEKRGAQVTLHQTMTGHQLTIEEVAAAKKWLASMT
ncbi:alpha/beta hydrolase [Vagococcus acidifermentans]|uniref:Phospholipase n=1 Tax=Vagococcus acidifermentans TaxID=564710 RepID=A0A430AVJ4_9ENTE|nr:alpha/beta hydrolase [Vagococcus acidifermentans]RSU12077.1 phospholipase [Vagococcus acidifermentans]